MKIALMEWLCGGGIGASQTVMGSLFDEGWGMLQCLASQLLTGDHQVKVPLDERLRSRLIRRNGDRILDVPFRTRLDIDWVDVAALESSVQNRPSTETPGAFDGLLETWLGIAQQCDAALVIAPEIDDILELCVHYLSTRGVRLLNCRDPLLELSADKLMAAQAFNAFGVEHPPSILVGELCEAWLRTAESECGNRRWVVKPRKGAGCDGLRIIDDPSAFLNASCREMGLMIQPWYEGRSFSRSAIIDAGGEWHWLPMMTQEFGEPQSSGRVSPKSNQIFKQPIYKGGMIVEPSAVPGNPSTLLRRLEECFSDGGLAWVGVDLIHDDRRQVWSVIEVNPRCTTSLIPLSNACHGNLADELVALSLGLKERLELFDSNQ